MLDAIITLRQVDSEVSIPLSSNIDKQLIIPPSPYITCYTFTCAKKLHTIEKRIIYLPVHRLGLSSIDCVVMFQYRNR
jgi:hypothetical protein